MRLIFRNLGSPLTIGLLLASSSFAQLTNPENQISSVEITIGSKCADIPKYSKSLAVTATTMTGKPSPISVGVCRVVRQSDTNGNFVLKPSFEFFSSVGGKTVDLGCFMPGYNEIHVAWVAVSSAKPNLMDAQNVLSFWKNSSYTVYNNDHMYKDVVVKYSKPGGGTAQVTLKPGNEVITKGIIGAAYSAPYDQVPTLEASRLCYRPTEKSPTFPWPQIP